MEVKKQSVLSKAYERVQQSFFDIMLDLLREKVTGMYKLLIYVKLKINIWLVDQMTACFLMFVMFLQIVS